MDGRGQDSQALPDLFRRLDARNRENVARAGLGIRTSADIFEESQMKYEQAKAERDQASQEGYQKRAGFVRRPDVGSPQNVVLTGSGIQMSADVSDTASGISMPSDTVEVEGNPRRIPAGVPRDGSLSAAAARPGDLFRVFRMAREGNERARPEGIRSLPEVLGSYDLRRRYRQRRIEAPRNASSSERPGSEMLFRIQGDQDQEARREGNPVPRQSAEPLPERFGRYDARNQQNVAQARLDIRTSAELYQAAQADYERARTERYARRRARRRTGRSSEPSSTVGGQKTPTSEGPASEPIGGRPLGNFAGAGAAVEGDVVTSSRQGQETRKKRPSSVERNQPGPKRTRTTGHRERSREEQMEELVSILRGLDEEFAEKERLSREQTWCTPIPHGRKVSTARDFYAAFHDTNTLPIHTCTICYRKYAIAELEDVSWEQWMASAVEKPGDSPLVCRKCFPVGEDIVSCRECMMHLGRGVLSAAAQLHLRLGCEHMYPEELKELTPVEEKLIALNSCYGFITKYSISEGQRQGLAYPRHVKGHITVFPNNVQELATRVLPHPLLRVMEDIHVSWQGREKPAPGDLTALLSVRRRVVERALVWLKKHNFLYKDIDIDWAEMDSWDAPKHGVPSQVYGRLERNEPSAREKTQTAHIVPSTERGLDDLGPVDIGEILASLDDGQDILESLTCDHSAGADDGVNSGKGARDQVHEISASGMFGVDGQPDIADAEKLRYVCEAVGEAHGGHEVKESTWAGSAEVRHGQRSAEPYIHVSRGEAFADSSNVNFFAMTFPTLFPFGRGGPRQAEEHILDARQDATPGLEVDATAQRLVSSRNMSLETWARLVQQRHGGRFAKHPVFSFLVFNIGVRSRNRRVSMASIRRKDFAEVERIVRSLDPGRLETAKIELESSGKTSDRAVNQLLRSLSLYGYRQPMSRESRLTMRRKIKSLIVRYGIPAIWFTLNPNDITNPVKLRLAAYRFRDPDEAEAFLLSLDQVHKRARLAISDPLSSAIFFHREISMFFKYYVRTGEESVFGRISQYFGAVETNERGALHLHGLLWLQGNMYLSSFLTDVQREEQVAYRDKVMEYIDSVFTEVCPWSSLSLEKCGQWNNNTEQDLDEAGFSAMRASRSVTSDVSSLFQNREQFAAAFEEEANFCAGATQIHTHSPTCVKYSIRGQSKGRVPCRFGAPWKLVEKTSFKEDGVLQIRRSHSLVNRWNKAMAVGLRHNHDISAIATKCKSLALIFYLTNYATKVEDPVWKRVVAARELFEILGDGAAQDQPRGVARSTESCRVNTTRQFLMRVANRVFTERTLSQVEVVSYLQGYKTEFASNSTWTFLNVVTLYWHIFGQWRYLRWASGRENPDEGYEDTILLGEAGQRISYLHAYAHRGSLLKDLALYDYMSIVILKRKGRNVAGWGEIEFDSSWPASKEWVQTLRRPGEYAVVCLDGYLGMNFADEDENYYRRAAVQHLALFVPWQAFLSETAGDINDIWERQKQGLRKRISFLVDNIQLLRRSAEDVKCDARQWAARCGESDPPVDGVESDMVGRDGAQGSAFRSDGIGSAIRLVDVLRSAMSSKEVTAGSREISTMVGQLCHFQMTILGSEDELIAMMLTEQGTRTVSMPGQADPAEIPGQDQVRSIKSEQLSVSREREKMIQGIQSQPVHSAALEDVLDGFGGQDLHLTAADSDSAAQTTNPSMDVQLGPSRSFSEAGKQLAECFTLNQRQSIALRLVCHQLDRIGREEGGPGQLCQFISGEGGTGKSRIIAAIAELFARMGQSHRLLVTATSGTAAANINGITIHSACKFSKDTVPRGGRHADVDGFGVPHSSRLRIDGRAKMDWQEKYMLIIDEVSMLGARTLYAVNEQLCSLRESREDFGGIPVILFCGDFRQFRPVRERSILLPSAAFPWDEEMSFTMEQRRQHDKAHALWKKFTTAVILTEQVRAAGDPTLRQLLTRIRRGMQEQSDVDLLNSRCYQEGRRIPWESGITVVTPLNRNRWNLNIEAALAFQKQHQRQLRIFISQHKWTDGEPTEEESLMMLSQGDDSAIPAPAVFMFIPGMPVVVNRNTYQGLKVANGSSYTGLDVILDKAHPGHRVNADTILHFGPPAGILLASETTRELHFVGMPPGTILLTPISTKIERQRKRPWQQNDVVRRGLPCAAAFACTDYKVQSRTLSQVVLELRGTQTTVVNGEAVPSQCDPYSLYVQLSRCPSLDGIMLLSRARERDVVSNNIPEDMAAAEKRLQQLSEATLSRAESWDW